MFDGRCGAEALRGVAAGLATAPLSGDDAERIEEIRSLEEVVCAAQARQARLTAAFAASQRASQAAAGVPAARQGRGIAEQVALARRESPHRGRQHVGLAMVAPGELPCVMAAFNAGLVPEWRVMEIARETACLSLEDRRSVDRAIAGDPEAFAGYSHRVVIEEVRKLVCHLDPAAVAARRRRAEADRCVTLRPAPDTMAYLTILLPVAQAVSVYAALQVAAATATGTGDPRGRGQLMADELVTRATSPRPGHEQPGARRVAPVALHLVMTDQALFGGASDSAYLEGYGAIPAGLARELVADHLDTGDRLWLKRLYTSPATGQLVAMDSRSRLFRGGLRQHLRLRDQFCRTPWCNAPIRHSDHAEPVAHGGTTTAEDGQSLCAQCNHAKQAPGWTARPRPRPRARPGPDEPGHVVETTTPTGHTYTSPAPPLLALRAGVFKHITADVWARLA